MKYNVPLAVLVSDKLDTYADKKIMDSLTHDPVLGHINTFGGHPVSCAAGLAAFNVLVEEKLIDSVKEKEQLFLSLLKHPSIKAVRSCGLMIAVEFGSFETNKRVIDAAIARGVFTDWFLFAPNCLRIVPPLVITNDEIVEACRILIATLSKK
jgi:acetylornithine/succinyldiaminopimelate/putrescine aminotransferase